MTCLNLMSDGDTQYPGEFSPKVCDTLHTVEKLINLYII